MGFLSGLLNPFGGGNSSVGGDFGGVGNSKSASATTNNTTTNQTDTRRTNTGGSGGISAMDGATVNVTGTDSGLLDFVSSLVKDQYQFVNTVNTSASHQVDSMSGLLADSYAKVNGLSTSSTDTSQKLMVFGAIALAALFVWKKA